MTPVIDEPYVTLIEQSIRRNGIRFFESFASHPRTHTSISLKKEMVTFFSFDL